jgi:cytochrome c553
MKSRLLAAAACAALFNWASAADDAANWENHCVSCHGVDGKGETKQGKKLKIKDLTDAAYQASFTDEDAFKAIKDGVKDDSGKQKMKPIEGLGDDEMKALVAYVRGLKK